MVLRVAGALVLTLTALFFLLTAWFSQDRESHRSSFEKAQLILADFQLLGAKAKAFKAETGRFPNADELQGRIDPAALAWFGPQRRSDASREWKLSEMLDIKPPKEPCALPEETRLSKEALRYHRLCHWRGEWFEEYVLETGEHSLPASLDSYLAAWWQTAGMALLGSGLLAAAYALVMQRPRRPAAA